MPGSINNKRRFTICRVTAYIIGFVSVAAGVLTPNAIIAVIGTGIGMVILISARLRYRVVNCDEQTLKISRRAASAAFRLTAVGLLTLYIQIHVVYPFIATVCEEAVGGWLATLVSLMLWCYFGTMSGDTVGGWLAIPVSLMLWCYIGFYYYYRRRM